MKYVIILLILLLLLPLINAESTFFDNLDDSFIMGNSVTGRETPGSGVTGETGGGCLTNWGCSSWSYCIDGIQIRNCAKEKADCYADLKKKPAENQSCSFGTENESNINNLNSSSSNVKTIILVILIIVVISIIIFFGYKKHRKRRYYHKGY